ncbi:MAG: hypothetical protein ACTH5C_10200 [Pseudoalteromonas prydzensis]|uniref:hypothetical protein n=1 Tax=Pseudoalteromonas prydzensis TaxID=182141 RepID=UPI001CE4416A
MKNLVTATWLNEHLTDPKLVIFDAGMVRPGLPGNISLTLSYPMLCALILKSS